MLSHDGNRFRGPRVVAGAVSVLAIVGCAVGPDFVAPPPALNEGWAEKDDPRIKTDAAVSAAWWKAFNDPTLDDLIAVACRQNLPLQIAGLRILEARAQLGIATGLQYPQVQEVFADATAVGRSENTANGAFIEHRYLDYQFGFDAAWELDLWGKYRRGVEAETATLAASVVDYDGALVSLTAEVARTYAMIRTYEVLVDLARENASTQQEGLEIAESRFRNGVTTELDVAQARWLLESTKATIPQLQIELARAHHALSTLLGQPVGDVRDVLEGPPGIPTAPPEVAVGMPAELLRRRPDIRGAELAAIAQCARIGIAAADLYPAISLVGEIGLAASDGDDTDLRHIFDGDSLMYSVGPAINWPVLNYGRIKNNVRVQDARYQQLLVNYQDTVLRAAQEVEDALTGFLRAQEAAVFGQNSVDAARRSVEIALVQYREGATDYQRVLYMQRFLLQEENTLAQTRSSIATNLVALYKALGGGWEFRQGQPIVAASTQAAMQERTDWGGLLPPPAPEDVRPPPPTIDAPLPPRPDW